MRMEFRIDKFNKLLSNPRDVYNNLSSWMSPVWHKFNYCLGWSSIYDCSLLFSLTKLLFHTSKWPLIPSNDSRSLTLSLRANFSHFEVWENISWSVKSNRLYDFRVLIGPKWRQLNFKDISLSTTTKQGILFIPSFLLIHPLLPSFFLPIRHSHNQTCRVNIFIQIPQQPPVAREADLLKLIMIRSRKLYWF